MEGRKQSYYESDADKYKFAKITRQLIARKETVKKSFDTEFGTRCANGGLAALHFTSISDTKLYSRTLK